MKWWWQKKTTNEDILRAVQKLEAKVASGVQEMIDAVRDAEQSVKDAVAAAAVRVSEDVAALQQRIQDLLDQIAAGEVVTPEQLAELGSIKEGLEAVKADVDAGFDPVPDVPPADPGA